MNKEANKSDYDARFNPDDISNWLSTSPGTFFTDMAHMVAEENTYIRLMADMLRQHPNIDSLSIVLGTMSLKDMLKDIIARTDRIHRVLQTGMAYMEVYEEGGLKPDS